MWSELERDKYGQSTVNVGRLCQSDQESVQNVKEECRGTHMCTRRLRSDQDIPGSQSIVESADGYTPESVGGILFYQEAVGEQSGVKE